MKKLLLILFLILAAPVTTANAAMLFASGSYGGNGADNRNIDISDTTTPSVADFQPEVVFVKCNSTAQLVFSTSAMPADTTWHFNASAASADQIQGFNANGFQVGANAAVNESGFTCYYWALANNASGDLAVGSFTGTNVDDRDVDISDTSGVPDFQPEFVLVKRSASSGALALIRTSAMAGDLSCQMNGFACTTNLIQALNPTGFQLGNAANANGNTSTIYYIAIKSVSGSTFAGSFTGNATDNQSKTDPGFQPQMMWIKGASATSSAIWRFKDHSGDNAFSITGVNTVNFIQQFLTTGFQVGSNNAVNESGVTMYYYTIRAPVVAPSSNILFRRRSQ